MAYRFYILPKIGTGTHTDPFRAKYVQTADGSNPTIAGAPLGHVTVMDYGVQPIMMGAADGTAAQHTAIAANADVLAAPATLTNAIGANLATTQSGLESRSIPAEWVTSGMTWQAMLLWLTRLFAFAQRYNGLFPTAPFLDAQTNLDATVGSVPVAARQRYKDTAQSFGFDASQITGSMTIREVFALVLPSVPDGEIAGLLRS